MADEHVPEEDESLDLALHHLYSSLPEADAAAQDDGQSAPDDARYELSEEIAHGGMGVVLRARDRRFGRDLAIKVMRRLDLDRPGMVERFFEEARIAGCLQHPGIVPIYEFGRLPDGRPFLTMKIVRGRTLAEHLRATEPSAVDRTSWLGVFLQICQAIAYAHSRGVIHRDLKPSNVMIGAFGEVQVMDWGLAKVLLREGDPHRDDEPHLLESPSDSTRSGSMTGTPGYMSPEQTRGDVEAIDRRSDVFALGVMLCELLIGATRDKEDLPRLLARVERAEHDRELIRIARRCLQSEPEARFADAGALADELAAHLASVRERARLAELEAAEAAVRVQVERRAHQLERRRRRQLTGLVAVVAVLIFATVAGYLTLQGRTLRLAEPALGEAQQALGAAEASPLEVALWERAEERALRAAGILASGTGGGRLAPMGQALQLSSHSGLERARSASLVLARLREIQSGLWADYWNDSRQIQEMDRACVAAFAEYGIGLRAVPIEIAGDRILASPIADQLGEALDEWIGRLHGSTQLDWRSLVHVAQHCDPDPWRRELRDAWLRDDRDRLRQLAFDPAMASRSLRSTHLLAALTAGIDPQLHRQVLDSAVRGHPGDFWIRVGLANACADGEPAIAAEQCRVALALRPDEVVVWNMLAALEFRAGDRGSALRTLDDALSRFPDNPLSLGIRASLVMDPDALRSAAADLDDSPERDTLQGVFTRAFAAEALARFVDAIAILDDGIAKYPDASVLVALRAATDCELGRFEDAFDDCDRAFALDPQFAVAWGVLSRAHLDADDADGAIAAARCALAVDSRSADAWIALSYALSIRDEPGDLAAAIEAADHAKRVHPQDPSLAVALADACFADGQLERALEEYSKARDRAEPGSKTGFLEHTIAVIGRLLAVSPELLQRRLDGETDKLAAEDLIALAELATSRNRDERAFELWLSALQRSADFEYAIEVFQLATSAACRVVNERSGTARATAARQALLWLEKAYGYLLEELRSTDAGLTRSAIERLTYWSGSSDFDAIRNETELVELPASDREAYRAFWHRIESVLVRAGIPMRPELLPWRRRGGLIDENFGDDGTVAVRNGGAQRIVPLEDGGFAILEAQPTSFTVSRFGATGQLVPDFGVAGTFSSGSLDLAATTVHAIELLPSSDRSWLVVGDLKLPESGGAAVERVFALRLTEAGRLDPTFARDDADGFDGGLLFPASSAMAAARYEHGDERDCVLIAGVGPVEGGASRHFLLRVDALGHVDRSGRFGTDGQGIVSDLSSGDGLDRVKRILLRSDGGILLVGEGAPNGKGHAPCIVARTATGTDPDTGYGDAGICRLGVESGATQIFDAASAVFGEDQSLVLATGTRIGEIETAAMHRVDSSGHLTLHRKLRLSRNPTSGMADTRIAVDAAGRIVIAGFSTAGEERRLVVWQLDAQGNDDESFGCLGICSHRTPQPATGMASVAIDRSGGLLLGDPSGVRRVPR